MLIYLLWEVLTINDYDREAIEAKEDYDAPPPGRLAPVTFLAESGELRTLNGCMGVIQALRHPVVVGVNILDKDAYITIWDMQKKGYRSIARDSIVSVSINHQHMEA